MIDLLSDVFVRRATPAQCCMDWVKLRLWLVVNMPLQCIYSET